MIVELSRYFHNGNYERENEPAGKWREENERLRLNRRWQRPESGKKESERGSEGEHVRASESKRVKVCKYERENENDSEIEQE